MTMLLMVAPALAAQADPDSVKQRNDCRLAAQVLSTGHPGPDRRDALSTIVLCGSMALPVLGDQWDKGELDSIEVQILATSTRPYASDFLAERLLQVIGAPSYSRTVRLTAMAVLINFMDPRTGVHPEDLARPEHGPFTITDHAEYQLSPGLLTIPLRSRLFALAQQLAANDPDAIIRRAAGHLIVNLRN